MGFRCGIIGLPNVGKSTIFNAMTAQGAASANFPFCTIEPNTGRVALQDPRLDEIAKLVSARKIVPASMDFVDIAGLVKGASKGEGLGNQFLSHIRECEAVAHVVRCFEDDDITHVEGGLDPIRDIEIIETELLLADLQTLEKSLERARRVAKATDAKKQVELRFYEEIYAEVEQGRPILQFLKKRILNEDEEKWLHSLHLISAKKLMYVCNLGEANPKPSEAEYARKVEARAAEMGAMSVRICGKLEEEINELGEEGRQEMLEGLGIKEAGLTSLVRAGFKLLGLQTYFTAGEVEARAWTIEVGDKAPKAAGKIHSDFERGFICAEVMKLEDLRYYGSKVKAKEAGKLRLEGKEYVVLDGDIIEFRFNV